MTSRNPERGPVQLGLHLPLFLVVSMSLALALLPLATALSPQGFADAGAQRLSKVKYVLGDAELAGDAVPCCELAQCDGDVTVILLLGDGKSGCTGGSEQCSGKILVFSLIIGDSGTTCTADTKSCSNNVIEAGLAVGNDDTLCGSIT